MRSLFLLFFVLLAGCSSSPDKPQQPETKTEHATPGLLFKPNTPTNDDPNAGRYSLKDDRAPTVVPDFSKVPPVVPHYEPYSRGGNKDYTLRGKRYRIIKNTKGYTETGYASWYGEKFHGHKTSNGETYNMFAMTAAHKTLPLPSFVRVTNTRNGKSTIVRVNDRGPFHDGRIIDLSMAAAAKIGVISLGTAPVKIEVINVPKPSSKEAMKNSPIPHHYFVQLAAVNSLAKAEEMRKALKRQYNTNVDIEQVDNRTVYRVRLGPFMDHNDAERQLSKAKAHHYPKAFIITANR
ncbi:septal ring lytic transglycosylase RlpA family protein [Photobacterium leiognathi]|uniref:septal ring lytic transglycosylase RlpA family protein n=1 Tax=Photobacterium leiognathi TaxID=553611 RepID=UPI002735C431|nr:septal ring lytic transglycosylase RlpA family protein [Photobacterium leiognathi]